MGFGKFVGLFVVRLIWFGIKLLSGFIGCSFIRRFLARIFFWVVNRFHCRRVFWWKCQTGGRNYQVLAWYISFPTSSVFGV